MRVTVCGLHCSILSMIVLIPSLAISNVAVLNSSIIFYPDVSIAFRLSVCRSFPMSAQPHVCPSMGPSLHLSVLSDCLKVLWISLGISLCTYISHYVFFLLLICCFV